jgi:hypothetical protein
MSDLENQIWKRLADGQSWRHIARELKVSPKTISKVAKLAKVNRKDRSNVIDSIPENRDWEESGDTAKVTAHTREHVRTEEDAVRVCQIDLKKWEPVSLKVKAYQGFHKDETTQKANVVQMYSVCLTLKRRFSKRITEASDILWGRFREGSSNFESPKYVVPTDPLLGVVCLFDAHLGKLSWAEETGSNYDLKIAGDVWRNAVDDILDRVEGKRLDRVVLPIGNDLVHIDNADNKTRNGTVVDTDGRYVKIIVETAEAVRYAVERFAQRCPVEILWVPGNHDSSTSFHIAHYLSALYSKHPGIRIDCSPTVRKYISWRHVLLGFTHGDDIKPTDLPSIMAVETKKIGWATSDVADWFLGHVHHLNRWVTKDIGEQKGVTVRTMRSLAANDAWHTKRGYIGSVRSAEAHFYGPSHWDSCVSVIAREGRE